MVSVVMSVFNGERFLREAVESVLEQTFREFEFIVVDDGSTDQSASILDSYRKSDARVRVYHQENKGLIESLNRGCSLAQGKYIARMDADDIAVRERLMWQVDFMEKHPQVAVLGGAVEWIDATGKSLGTHNTPVADCEIKSELLHRNVFWHPTVIMLREGFVSSGGYRKVVVDAEDYDLWLRIADRCQLANLETVVLKYRIHPFQVSMSKRRQQTLCKLAAQASASLRRNGTPDPLEAVKEITPAVLAELGVTEARQQSVLASDWRNWIRNMCLAGEYSVALKAADGMLQSDLQYVERWQIADLYLIIARLYWRQKRLLKSFLAAVRAVMTRPVVAGRPLKLLLRRLGLA
ncbi:MAG: glycosyltransferase [Acidobacteriia bacterium]|nr:glycosyltransferase [Terriglobia bacterium]